MGSMNSTTVQSTMTSNLQTSDFENVNFENLITELFRKEDLDKHKKVDKLNLTAKLDFFQRQLTEISSFAYRYDPKTGLKSNGFRSFLKLQPVSDAIFFHMHG